MTREATARVLGTVATTAAIIALFAALLVTGCGGRAARTLPRSARSPTA